MFSESDLKRLVEEVLVEMTTKEGANAKDTSVCESNPTVVDEDGIIPDITEIDIRTNLLVDNPENTEEYLKMKKHTPARIGVGKAGTRYKTQTILRFRADHAAAQDAVFTDVDEKILQDMNLETIQTMCSSKDEFITRPDLGRKISKEELSKLSSYKKNAQVQIYVSDGLSSKAVEANVKNILPALIQGLEGYGISVGKPFFCKAWKSWSYGCYI